MKFIKYFDAGVDESMVRSFSDRFGVSEKVMRIIISRGYDTEQKISDFLWPEKVELQSPFTMLGMTDAVNTIKEYIKQNKRILVFGDYDVDGISATAIMIKTLKKMGSDAKYFLPNRYVDGYGLTKNVLLKIKNIYSPDLIITVDCGITAVEEVEYAKTLGIKMIITDHHEIPDKIPDCIVINTKFQNQEYSFRGLCGTGVAYKLSEALTSLDEASEYLPIVSIATIADIVPLVSENRILTRLGFACMDKLPLGLKHMFNANKVSIKEPDSSDIAFKIAPKLNASGRMGDAVDSLLLYFENNPSRIKELINKIMAHNTKRQELGTIINEDCKRMLKDKDITNMPAIILWSDNWDQGILGIECSKILEEYNRPVFLFTKDGEYLKGSARSINDINIHNILTSVSDILEVFGGHTMAAGLTLRVKHFDEFVKRVNSYIYENINFKAFEPIEYYDDKISLKDINNKFIEDLKLLEPCGSVNPKAKFLIESDDITIQPLTNSFGHANIVFGKNMSAVFFNYLKESNKLNFGSNFKFIIEFQNMKGKYFKGIVRDFDFDGKIKESATKYLDSSAILQLKGSANSAPNFSFFEEKDLIKFVLDCSKSVFGTVFVASTVQSFKEFTQKYDMSNIYSFNISQFDPAGFNSVLLAPSDISFAKKYKRIVFLDAVLDLSYISEINKISNAEVLVMNNKHYSKQLFKDINLDRKHFAQIYQALLEYVNVDFNSIYSLYNKLVKNIDKKINYKNFLVPFCVFKELNILNLDDTKNSFKYLINKEIRTNLNDSSMYNQLNLIKKSIGE